MSTALSRPARRFRSVHLMLVASLVASLAVSLVPAAKALPVSVPPKIQDTCQPDPTWTGEQILNCRYGPIEITPGENLILVGPTSIESPRADGFMLSMKPNMIDAVTDKVPAIHEVHLHHGVWLNGRHDDPDAIGTPFMAAGEEKTVSSTPPGYGYRVKPTDEWLLNYMIHNQTAQHYNVVITYQLKWINRAPALAQGIKDVVPLWFDEVGGFYPVYNPTNTGPEVKTDSLDPTKTVHVRRRSFSVNRDMEIVWMAGHVHPGGLRLDVKQQRCGGQNKAPDLLFSSKAIPNLRNGVVPTGSFGSWDYRMSVTEPGWTYTMKAGDRLEIDSVYDISHPWYEAMGIVFGWGHPLAAGETPTRPLCDKPPVSGTPLVTNDLPDAPIFGGDRKVFDDPATMDASGPPVSLVRVAAFDYIPGGLAQTPAPVKAGSTVRFENDDAAAMIYHSITSCADACNRTTGQSYPKPSWSFDSGQLGYGIDGATAANGGVRVNTNPMGEVNDIRSELTNGSFRPERFFNSRGTTAHYWDWTVPANAQVGDTFTYYCRVHPFMRGSVQVVEEA